jgi:uncharacterized protein
MSRSAQRSSHADANASPRLDVIDALRGFALFGVFGANLLIFSGIVYMNDGQRAALFTSRLDPLLYWLEHFLIENKFIGLFSVLFGVSFWLFLGRVQARGAPGTVMFYRRIFWLFVIGLVHGWLLWCFDILRFYALWEILLPLFVRTPTRVLLAVALSASILVPAAVSGIDAALAATPHAPAPDYDAFALAAFSSGTYADVLRENWRYDWYLTLEISQIAYQVAVFGRLLLGLYIARALDLGNLAQHRRLLRGVLLVGGVLGAAGSVVFANDLLSEATEPAVRFVQRLLVETGHLGFTLTYASGLALLSLGGLRHAIVGVLAPIGRMALTFYLLHTLLGIWIFYGFARGPAAMGRTTPSALLVLLCGGFAVQILAAKAWAAHFRFGPAEWIWRGLTYATLPPLRITDSRTSAAS